MPQIRDFIKPNSLEPFDIVTSPYVSLDGSIKTNSHKAVERSLFLVVAVGKDNTVTCCKISSKGSSGNVDNNFQLKLASHPFLQTESFIQVDKLQTLFVSSCKKVGSMYDGCRRLFISRFTLVLGNFRMSLEKYAPKYTSPNDMF